MKSKGLFANFSIRTKLAVGFGLIIAALFAVTVVSGMAIYELRTMQDAIYKEDIPTMSDLLLLSDNMNRLEAAVQMLILIDDLTVKDREVSEISDITQSTNKILKNTEGRFQQDPEALEVLVALEKEMSPFNDPEFVNEMNLPIKPTTTDQKAALLHKRSPLFRSLKDLSASLKGLPERLATKRRAAAEAHQKQTFIIFAAVCSSALLAAVALVMLMNKLIASPLLKLTSAMHRIAAGELSISGHYLSSDRKDELGVLARSFVKMSQALKERTDQLDSAIRRTRAILQTAPDGIISLSQDGVIEAVNEATQDLFDYHSTELYGKSVLTIMPDFEFPENAIDMSGQQMRVTYQPGGEILNEQRWRKQQEMIGVCKDGSTFPLEVASSVLNLSDRKIVTCIVRDISERKEMERRVSEFYSMVSHELRAPLTSIRASLGLMEGGKLGELTEKTKRFVVIARSESDRLIRLINDFLDMRKIEAGKLELHLDDVVPAQLIEATIEGLRGFADKEQIELTGEYLFNDTIRGDGDRLRQVLTNLTSNAIKFSHEGDEVILRVEPAAEAFVRFSVVDKGDGIPADQLHKLFARFQQTESARSKGGTGLGLAISKAIVEQHGGKIGVESVVGLGSVFWFEVPLAIPEEKGQNPMAVIEGIERAGEA